MGSARCPAAAPASAAGLFPRIPGWEQRTEGKWHSLAQPPSPDIHTGFRCPLPAVLSQQHKAPTLGAALLLGSVSHITDVTSPRHRSSEMDLMSLCFPQLRKTSKRLSLQHPEEPAGCSVTVSVPTGGQRTAKGASGLAESFRDLGTTSRSLQSISVLSRTCQCYLPHRTRQVSPCCAWHCSDSMREQGTSAKGQCHHTWGHGTGSLKASAPGAEEYDIPGWNLHPCAGTYPLSPYSALQSRGHQTKGTEPPWHLPGAAQPLLATPGE